MKLILDAMGGDNAPRANIYGAVQFAKESKTEVVLVGKKEIITEILNEALTEMKISKLKNISIVDAREEILMEDIPTKAIKGKKDSSMVVGLNMVKADEKGEDVFISAGNTGALLTGATLLVGRIKGIIRPAIATTLPAVKGEYVLIDSGANTNCKEENFMQFAQMASIYLKLTKKQTNPTVGLLNIGTEDTKGNELYKSVFQYMKENAEENNINFIGNIEGRTPFKGGVDIVVSDGFVGNVFLKTIEGVGKMLKANLKELGDSLGMKKVLLFPMKKDLLAFANRMDYKRYGGGLFLGIKNPIVKAHGSADQTSFYFTLKQAEVFGNSGITQEITREILKEKRGE